MLLLLLLAACTALVAAAVCGALLAWSSAKHRWSRQLESAEARWALQHQQDGPGTVIENVTLGWLNVLLQSLWGSVIEKHVSGLTAELLQKVFSEVLEKHAAKVPWKFVDSIAVEEMSFGLVPPTLQGGQMKYDPTSSMLTMNLDVRFISSSAQAVLLVKSKQAGLLGLGLSPITVRLEVTHIKLKGRLRLGLRLGPQPPGIQGVYYSFVSPPHLDIAVRPLGMPLPAILPGLDIALRGELSKLLSKQLVEPQRRYLDVNRIYMNKHIARAGGPGGLLKVVVLSATNLSGPGQQPSVPTAKSTKAQDATAAAGTDPSSTATISNPGKSSSKAKNAGRLASYCELKFGRLLLRTPIVHHLGTRDAVWNWEFALPLPADLGTGSSAAAAAAAAFPVSVDGRSTVRAAGNLTGATAAAVGAGSSTAAWNDVLSLAVCDAQTVGDPAMLGRTKVALSSLHLQPNGPAQTLLLPLSKSASARASLQLTAQWLKSTKPLSKGPEVQKQYQARSQQVAGQLLQQEPVLAPSSSPGKQRRQSSLGAADVAHVQTTPHKAVSWQQDQLNASISGKGPWDTSWPAAAPPQQPVQPPQSPLSQQGGPQPAIPVSGTPNGHAGYRRSLTLCPDPVLSSATRDAAGGQPSAPAGHIAAAAAAASDASGKADYSTRPNCVSGDSQGSIAQAASQHPTSRSPRPSDQAVAAAGTASAVQLHDRRGSDPKAASAGATDALASSSMRGDRQNSYSWPWQTGAKSWSGWLWGDSAAESDGAEAAAGQPAAPESDASMAQATGSNIFSLWATSPTPAGGAGADSQAFQWPDGSTNSSSPLALLSRVVQLQKDLEQQQVHVQSLHKQLERTTDSYQRLKRASHLRGRAALLQGARFLLHKADGTTQHVLLYLVASAGQHNNTQHHMQQQQQGQEQGLVLVIAAVPESRRDVRAALRRMAASGADGQTGASAAEPGGAAAAASTPSSLDAAPTTAACVSAVGGGRGVAGGLAGLSTSGGFGNRLSALGSVGAGLKMRLQRSTLLQVGYESGKIPRSALQVLKAIPAMQLVGVVRGNKHFPGNSASRGHGTSGEFFTLLVQEEGSAYTTGFNMQLPPMVGNGRSLDEWILALRDVVAAAAADAMNAVAATAVLAQLQQQPAAPAPANGAGLLGTNARSSSNDGTGSQGGKSASGSQGHRVSSHSSSGGAVDDGTDASVLDGDTSNHSVGSSVQAAQSRGWGLPAGASAVLKPWPGVAASSMTTGSSSNSDASGSDSSSDDEE